MMAAGIVHVRPVGTPYPHTQTYYNQKATHPGNSLINDGYDLLEQMRQESDSHHITIGATDGLAMVMLFVLDMVKLHVGDTVTFINRTPTDDPHTVSTATTRVRQ
jgi:plastocyanin